ncbi:MAG: protein kinase [Anaerolineae bacterium]|jgi:serine/threonine protein kinase
MLQPGTILDNKYRIEAVIGRGGFGHVYRARERLTGEVVAIKELLPSLFYDGEIAQRFIQEARATLRLTHSHIARSFGVFHDQNTYYLAMEFLPGGSLADRLKRGSLPVPEVLRIARDLCQALAYAHQEGVIHCDIKPGNVLFDERGRAHLADFGIAHVSTDLMTRRLFTATGVTMGTVRHMAPEQLEGVRDDPRLDVYAVGTVLYEMIAGRPYLDFEEETTPAAQMRNMQRIQTALPRPLRALCPTVPGHVVGAVERALQKAPTDRFSTIDGLAQALQRADVLAPEPVRSRPAAPPTHVVPDPAEGEVGAPEREPAVIPSEDPPESAARPGPSVKRPVAEKPLAEIAGAHAPPPADQGVPPAVAPRRSPRISTPVADLSPVKHLWAQLADAWRLAPD